MTKCKRCGEEQTPIINEVMTRALLGLSYDSDLKRAVPYDVNEYCLPCLGKILLDTGQ